MYTIYVQQAKNVVKIGTQKTVDRYVPIYFNINRYLSIPLQTYLKSYNNYLIGN